VPVASTMDMSRATASGRLLGKGRRTRCVARRLRLRRPSRCGSSRRLSTVSFTSERHELASVCDDLDWEERGALAAAEFLRRAVMAMELRSAAAAARAARHVHFTEAPSVFEVPAYSEIYGLHPREFVFDRKYGMVPAQGPFGFNGFDFTKDDDSEAESSESDDEFDDF